ncbi:hypothetical protein DXB85_06605 [Parabacteroides merdae]|nr:hypothetical protein DXB85_06605 [Parabacteroides merdae]
MEGRNGVGDFAGGQSRALPLRGGDAKGRYKETTGDTKETTGRYKETKRGMQKEKWKKGKEKQAVSAIIRESSAFWERPKRTGVKRRVKA